MARKQINKAIDHALNIVVKSCLAVNVLGMLSGILRQDYLVVGVCSVGVILCWFSLAKESE